MSSSTPINVVIGGFGPMIRRPATPFPFLEGPNGRTDDPRRVANPNEPLTTKEEIRIMLCGAIGALCRCELPRPFDARQLYQIHGKFFLFLAAICFLSLLSLFFSKRQTHGHPPPPPNPLYKLDTAADQPAGGGENRSSSAVEYIKGRGNHTGR